MSIRVVNLRNYRLGENEVLVKVDRSSVLGNVYIMRDESMRDEVCDKYAKYFDNKVKIKGSDFRNEVIRIYRLVKSGKNVALGCWCSPKRCHADYIKEFIEKYVEESKGSSKLLYQVRWDFLNEEGKWKVDTLTNNGKGFTLEDAKDVKRQLANDEVCIKKNLAIVPLYVHHTLEKPRDNGDIDRWYFESTQNAGEISIHKEIVIMNYDCNGGVEYIKKASKLASFNGAKWHYARMLSIGFRPSPMDENWLEASK